MFNMTILDVAIGMIFIFLLLSLMCTAANEIIEQYLKKRSGDLERGIREMLLTSGEAGSNDIVNRLYNHPLVNGLFRGTYEDSKISGWKRIFKRSKLPSYIPARSFALALMDLIQPVKTTADNEAGLSGTAGTTAPSLSPSSPAQVVVTVAGDSAGSVVSPSAAASPAASAASLSTLRNTLLASGDERIKKAIIPLLDAAGNDMTKARENIEKWYNDSMDRVTGWYTKRAKIIIFVLGLFVAIAVNVDTIKVVKRLSTDRPLRDSLVAAADAYSKANAEPAANVKISETSDASLKARETARDNACAGANSASAACQRAKDAVKACENEDSPKCQYLTTQQQILSLGLPIGWDDDNDPNRNFTSLSGIGNLIVWMWGQFRLHVFGWLLTALAISLGAPFWFDLLKKFMAVRSVIKPEKTSQEATT